MVSQHGLSGGQVCQTNWTADGNGLLCSVGLIAIIKCYSSKTSNFILWTTENSLQKILGTNYLDGRRL